MLALSPDCLENSRAMLLPLEEVHVQDLCTIGLDPAIWTFTTALNRTPEDMRRYVEHALEERALGRCLPYVIYDKIDGMLAGCTRFMNLTPEHKRTEIGSTWYSISYQGSGLNRHVKFLMLSFGFEVLDLNRIEFKTDSRNERSMWAIEKMGAKQEGIFRRHWINPDGYVRDTVYYSILKEEWPQTREAFFADVLTVN
ncbi:MAG: GNAT family protein [Bacteroidia bacterium]|nr:GNAT family protein [Bacteroidia bacterium]